MPVQRCEVGEKEGAMNDGEASAASFDAEVGIGANEAGIGNQMEGEGESREYWLAVGWKRPECVDCIVFARSVLVCGDVSTEGDY